MGVGSSATSRPPIQAVANVDINKFMGSWFVVGVIPTPLETNAFNPIESYKLQPDGTTVATTFSFNSGAPTGPRKVYHPTGYISDANTKGIWKMMFIWPIKVEYLIAHLDADYQSTIIARNARDYAWIMARTPSMAEDKYAAHVERLKDLGYDISRLIRPHQDPLPRETDFN